MRLLAADLTAAADEIDQTLESMPESPGPDDLRRMVGLVRKSDELVKRMEAVTPRLTEDNGTEYRPARDRFLGSLKALSAHLERVRPGGAPVERER